MARRRNANSTDYTADEEAYLRAHPGREERAEVARNLGRTRAAVTQRLSKLGVLESPSRAARPGQNDDRYQDREPLPQANPLDRLGRPVWFDEDRRSFARRLMGGK